MYATNIDDCCPIEVYAQYTDKRPPTMKSNDSPFCIAEVTKKENLAYNEK